VYERTLEVFDWLLQQSICENKIASEVQELRFELSKMLAYQQKKNKLDGNKSKLSPNGLQPSS